MPNTVMVADGCVYTFRGHRDSINTLVCDEKMHANTLASGSDDGTCRLWDLRTTRTSRCLSVIKALGLTSSEAQEYGVNSIAYGKDVNYIYVSTLNKVLTFDLRTEGMIISSLTKEVFQENEDEVNQIHIQPSKKGQFLSAPDDNGDIRIYDLENHCLFKTLRGQHTNICMSAPFRPNAGWDLVSGGMDGFVFFWDFSRGRIRHKLDFNIGVKTSGNQMFNPPLVHSIAFPNNGRTFAVGLGDASLAIVDFNTKQIKRRLKDFHTAAVSQVHFPVFNHDQSLLLSSGNDAKIFMWDYDHILSHDGQDPLMCQKDVIKKFEVSDKPNAITTSTYQNLVHISDVSSIISSYPVL